MQNTQNNFTVENLVAKYRSFVMEHCPKLCEFDGVEEFLLPKAPEANADEQLIVTLYKKVAGNNADERIAEALTRYAEVYCGGALTDDEVSFLCEHFSEVISFEFAHRHDWYSANSERISEERIRLVMEYVKPENGAKIFIADTEYCDIAALFPECVICGFTGWNYKQKEVWALGQIRLFAAGIQSEIVSGEEVNGEYSYTLPANSSVDVVIFRVNENKYFSQKIFGTECKDIEALYDLLKPNGKMIFFSEDMGEMVGNSWGKAVYNFRTRIFKEKNITSIVLYEEEDICGRSGSKNIMLGICKCENQKVCLRDEVLSRTQWINSNELDPEILLPGYYWTVRPMNGISLSSLVQIGKAKMVDEDGVAVFVKGEGWILGEKAKNMPLVTPSVLGDSYKDANIDCKEVKDKVETRMILCGVAKKTCVLLSVSTKNLRIGYTTNVPDNGIAFMECCCLIPKEGVDVRYVAALLFEPSVKKQILTICAGNIGITTQSVVLDKIIVPNHDDKERLRFMAEANYEALTVSQREMRQELENYNKAIRMRKHALTQALSSIEAKFNALNNCRIRQKGKLLDDNVLNPRGTTVEEVFEFISVKIKKLMPVLDHIADIEYSFSKPEAIDPEKFIENYIEREEKGWLNFKPVVSWKNDNNLAKQDIYNNEGHVILAKGDPLNTLVFSKDALERIFNNILSNVKSYAFTEDSRKDYQLRFSWYTDGVSIIIEIKNNGTPIPEDRDTASLLEYGVSTALHQDGHNGIGCNEIKDIMSRYNGRVDIVSTPTEEFTVKYVLTFDNAYVFRLQ